MAETKNIAAQLFQIMIDGEWADDLSDLTPESHLENDLGFDSFDFVRLVLALNHGFEIEIPSSDIVYAYFGTLGQLTLYLEGQVLKATGS